MQLKKLLGKIPKGGNAWVFVPIDKRDLKCFQAKGMKNWESEYPAPFFIDYMYYAFTSTYLSSNWTEKKCKSSIFSTNQFLALTEQVQKKTNWYRTIFLPPFFVKILIGSFFAALVFRQTRLVQELNYSSQTRWRTFIHGPSGEKFQISPWKKTNKNGGRTFCHLV